MKITWLGDTTGLDLKPTWEVSKIRLHTVKAMRQPDGSTRDTIVLVIFASTKEYRKLRDEYGPESVKCFGLLSSMIVPLFPNQVLWTWKSPRGYESSIKDGTYTAFEITEEETKNAD